MTGTGRSAGGTGGGPTARTPPPEATVVGGGIAGLAAAWELLDRGWQVTVVEADHLLGGKLRREVVAGTSVDVGPDAFITRRPEALALCRELGLEEELVHPGVTGAWVWARHRLRRLPDGLVAGVPTRLAPLLRSGVLGPLGCLRVAFDLVDRHPTAAADGARGRPAAADRAGSEAPPPGAEGAPCDWSVAELVAPRLGRAVVDRLVDPLIGGIHAGPTTAMSATAVVPDLVRAATEGGSMLRALRPPRPRAHGQPAAGRAPGAGAERPPLPLFASPRGGMAALAETLAAALDRRGARLRTGTTCTGLTPPASTRGRWEVATDAGQWTCDGVVVAVPSPQAAELLSGVGHARLARLLAGLEWAGVVVVTFAFPPDGPASALRHAAGTGFLVPASHGLLTTGCTWLSAKWPALYGEGPVLVRVSAGRDGDRRAFDLSDEALARRLLAEVRTLAGDVGEPIAVQVTRWPAAFPQFRVGYPSWLEAVEAEVGAVPGLALAGASYAGVGVPACIGSGRAAAASLAPTVGGP
jgi:oxygen-dependent protoporphyrinogen oxidase